MYKYRDDIKKIAERLKHHKSIAIISHIRPDADAISSQIGAALWLRNFGTHVLCHNDDPIPKNIKWLTDIYPVSDQTEDDLDSCEAFLFVDGNAPHRFGKHDTFFRKTQKPKYVIDHHPEPEPDFFQATVSIPKAGSTAELIYYLFHTTYPEWINHEVATALYTGIMSDTGSFRFDSVGAHTHQIVSNLIRRGGIEIAQIHERVYDTLTENQLKLTGRALGQIRIDRDTQLASMYVTEEDLEETGCSHEDLEGLISYPLSLEGIKIAILFSERDNKVKLSLRSKSDFDVNKLARHFDGGGHQKAAGAWHHGPIELAVEEVSQKVKELLSASPARK